MPKENKINFEKRDDKDLYYALHGCKLLSPKISSDGYFEVTIIDYWNFEYRDLVKLRNIKNISDVVNNLANDINNWGYDKQEKGEMENFFVIYSIREKMK